MDKYDVLKQYFGYDNFRPGQENIIDGIISGCDTLGVMPTGAGKSLCFQVPALTLSGIAIVISPLISLMTDQVNALVQSGVRAAYINSSLTAAQTAAVLNNAAKGVYKLIYVAPERLTAESFIRFAQNADISMVVVDEAHCISRWGQDFRPSYLAIPEFVGKLRKRPILAAFTATATQDVRNDIQRILGLNKPNVLVTGFDRKNLYFGVLTPDNKMKELVRLVREYTVEGGRSGIVYCSTRKNVERVCAELTERGCSATRYHAGLSENERRENQDDFTYDRKKVMVATNAFGMGIDKSNVSYVIHFNMPKDIESYYQEAGRAGRDGSPSDCIMLYSGQDVITNRFLIRRSREESELDERTADEVYNKDMQRLKFMTYYCTTAKCLRKYILEYFGEKSSSDCGNCSYCCSGTEETDITVEAQKILSCIYRCGQRYGKTVVSGVLNGSKREQIISRGLDKLSTYGIMGDRTEKSIRRLIDRLTVMGYINVTDDEYATLSLAPAAIPVLKGNKHITAHISAGERTGKKGSGDRDYSSFGGRKEKSASVGTGKRELYLSEEDKELLSQLKIVRSKIAAANNVPAYVIFNDASLYEMCCEKPVTKEDFRRISGVGDVKLERFGEKFISAISRYVAEKGGSADTISDPITYDTEGGAGGLVTRKSMIEISEEGLPLTSFVENMLVCTHTRSTLKSADVRKAIVEWLTKEGYLTLKERSDGKSETAATPKAGQVGINYVMRKGRGGESYMGIIYSPKAQRFIVANLEKIMAASNSI